MASAMLTASSVIESVLVDNWDEENDCTIAWPNITFTKPDGPWLRSTIAWGDGFEDTMGPTQTNRVHGVLIGEFFDREGSGEGTLSGLVDTYRDLFNLQVISGVRFGAASGPKPAGDEKGWHKVNVFIPFDIDDVV